MNKELFENLEKWFNSFGPEDHYVWNHTPIGKLIKSKLKEMGHWRNVPRGDSKLAYTMMKFYKAHKKWVADGKIGLEPISPHPEGRMKPLPRKPKKKKP